MTQKAIKKNMLTLRSHVEQIMQTKTHHANLEPQQNEDINDVRHREKMMNSET